MVLFVFINKLVIRERLCVRVFVMMGWEIDLDFKLGFFLSIFFCYKLCNFFIFWGGVYGKILFGVRLLNIWLSEFVYILFFFLVVILIVVLYVVCFVLVDCDKIFFG